jgi:hypothetical protein
LIRGEDDNDNDIDNENEIENLIESRFNKMKASI